MCKSYRQTNKRYQKKKESESNWNEEKFILKNLMKTQKFCWINGRTSNCNITEEFCIRERKRERGRYGAQSVRKVNFSGLFEMHSTVLPASRYTRTNQNQVTINRIAFIYIDILVCYLFVALHLTLVFNNKRRATKNWEKIVRMCLPYLICSLYSFSFPLTIAR